MTIRWEPSDPGTAVGVAKVLPLLRKAVVAAQDRPELKLQLARVLFASDQTAELIDLLKPSLTDDDAPPELLYWLGRAAMARGNDQLALVALRSAAAKGMANAFDFVAKALARLGREDEALDAGLEALKRLRLKSLRIVAAALCNRGETERLWHLCVDLRSRGGQGQLLSAVMASAAAMLAYATELEKLMDRSKWFFFGRLPVPEDFNRNLAAEILAERSARSLTGVATRGAGSRIDHFERVAGPHAQNLMGRIRAAVDSYIAERESFSSDPIMADRPAVVTLNSWALAMHEDGHTAWHIHPRGWISGVYYIDMPELKPAAADPPGAVEFGPFPFGGNTEALKSHCWHVMPEPGVLLLFPSYYAHRTIPTGVAAPRICVAFDVQPARAGSIAAAQQD